MPSGIPLLSLRWQPRHFFKRRFVPGKRRRGYRRRGPRRRRRFIRLQPRRLRIGFQQPRRAAGIISLQLADTYSSLVRPIPWRKSSFGTHILASGIRSVRNGSNRLRCSLPQFPLDRRRRNPNRSTISSPRRRRPSRSTSPEPAPAVVVEEQPVYVAAAPPPPPWPGIHPHGPRPELFLRVRGYWNWEGVQWAWVPGYWEYSPPGHIYIEPTYVMVGGRLGVPARLLA